MARKERKDEKWPGKEEKMKNGQEGRKDDQWPGKEEKMI